MRFLAADLRRKNMNKSSRLVAVAMLVLAGAAGNAAAAEELKGRDIVAKGTVQVLLR
jgi:hypothetical protein